MRWHLWSNARASTPLAEHWGGTAAMKERLKRICCYRSLSIQLGPGWLGSVVSHELTSLELSLRGGGEANGQGKPEDRLWPELNEVRSDLARGQLIHSCEIGSISSFNELRKLGK